MADVPQIKIRSFFKTKLLQRLGASLNSQDVTMAGEVPLRLKKRPITFESSRNLIDHKEPRFAWLQAQPVADKS